MTGKKTLTSLCDYLGKNNDAVIPVLFIALFKGVFRPIFTMMDKHEKPEVKKYAATREGLTEVVAFASYLVTSFAARAAAAPMCKKVYGKDVSKALVHKAEKAFSFVAVCIAAGFIIPAVCNLTLKPVMNALNKHKKAPINDDEIKKLDINQYHFSSALEPFGTQYKTQMSDESKRLVLLARPPVVTNSNMKVGG